MLKFAVVERQLSVVIQMSMMIIACGYASLLLEEPNEDITMMIAIEVSAMVWAGATIVLLGKVDERRHPFVDDTLNNMSKVSVGLSVLGLLWFVASLITRISSQLFALILLLLFGVQFAMLSLITHELYHS
jgi:hypothetical protein